MLIWWSIYQRNISFLLLLEEWFFFCNVEFDQWLKERRGMKDGFRLIFWVVTFCRNWWKVQSAISAIKVLVLLNLFTQNCNFTVFLCENKPYRSQLDDFHIYKKHIKDYILCKWQFIQILCGGKSFFSLDDCPAVTREKGSMKMELC